MEAVTGAAEAAAKRYTAADLIRSAKRAGHAPTRRLITDWVTLGLLDRAEPRGRGRGKGKEYTWPHNQRQLFLTLLQHHRTVRRPALCTIPVSLWLLWGDAYVPLRQVRRALATWADAYGTVSFTRAKDSAAQTLLQLDHPDADHADRERLRRLLTQAGKTGEVDFDELAIAVRAVIDPHESGISRGPHGLLDADSYVRLIRDRVEGVHAIYTASDGEYYAARRLYQTTGPTNYLTRYPLENKPRVINPRKFQSAVDPGLEAAINNACLDLITSLGIVRLDPPNPAFMTKEGPPPPRWKQPRQKLKKK